MSEVGPDISEQERQSNLSKDDIVPTSEVLQQPSPELLGIFQQYEQQVAELYSQVDQWHGTGRYQVVYEDEGRTRVKEVQDILKHIAESGLKPQADNFDKLRGRGTSSISTTVARPYAMMYAALHNGNELQYRFHDSKYWTMQTALGAFRRIPEVILEEYRNYGLKGVIEARPTMMRKGKVTDAMNWKKKVDPSILGEFEDYPIVIGLREGAFNPVRMSMLIKAYHEQRSHDPIPLDTFSHIEVPLSHMDESKQILEEKGVTLPVIPMEMGEIYSTKFSPRSLVAGTAFKHK
jgi:hypothetical protein